MRFRRMERRCAGVVDAAGVAGGEMGEDSLDDVGRLDARDDVQCGATHATVFDVDVDVEDSLEPLHPAHGRGTRRMRLAGGLMGRVGDDTAAVFEVRGEHAVVSGEMGAGTRHRASSLRERHFRGDEAGDKVHRVEHDMSGPVTEGVLESIHDLPAVIDREAFVRECWAGDVAAQAFERVPLMGSAARADPRLHHSGGGYGGRIPRAERCRGWTPAGLDATVRRVRALRPA